MNTALHHPTALIEAPEDVPVIVMTRDFAGTPDQLFRAHTDPDLFVRWIGPDGYATEIDRWDARTGGSWRYVNGGHGFFGSFHDVSERRIVQTFTWEGMPEAVCLETFTLEDLGGGRTRLHARSVFENFEARNGMLASGMEGGVNDGYAKLDQLLTELPAELAAELAAEETQ